MCDVRKKLILANVVIEEYKKWQIEVRKVKKDEVFNGFSTTLLMKLLYLSCLLSIEGKIKTYRNTPFGILDKWIALPNGPVEDDIYSAIGYKSMPTISYDFSKKDSYKYSESEINDKYIKEINTYYEFEDSIKLTDTNADILNKLAKSKKFDLNTEKEQIEQGFNKLVNEPGIKIDVSTSKKNDRTINCLSKFSHLILWNAALSRNAKKLATDNIYLLEDELNYLKRKIQAA